MLPTAELETNTLEIEFQLQHIAKGNMLPAECKQLIAEWERRRNDLTKKFYGSSKGHSRHSQ